MFSARAVPTPHHKQVIMTHLCVALCHGHPFRTHTTSQTSHNDSFVHSLPPPSPTHTTNESLWLVHVFSTHSAPTPHHKQVVMTCLCVLCHHHHPPIPWTSRYDSFMCSLPWPPIPHPHHTTNKLLWLVCAFSATTITLLHHEWVITTCSYVLCQGRPHTTPQMSHNDSLVCSI